VFSTPRELIRFIAEMRELAGGKPAGFKLCVGTRHELMAICSAMVEEDYTPDFIIVDGSEGGTGAAPAEYEDHVGTPLTEDDGPQRARRRRPPRPGEGLRQRQDRDRLGHLVRRVDHMTSKNYAELFDWLRPGQLLDDAPEAWAVDWARADPDSFVPRPTTSVRR
jgi:hypothetical protein